MLFYQRIFYDLYWNSNKELIKTIFKENSTILLTDKIAFMARFFENEEILPELEIYLKNCVQDGLIEGIILAGFTFNAFLI